MYSQIPYPFGIQILGQPGLSTYSIMLMIAFLTASFLAPRELRRRGLRPEVADWGLLIAVIGAIVGSKVFYILEIWGRIWIIDLSWWDTFKEVFFSWDGMAVRDTGVPEDRLRAIRRLQHIHHLRAVELKFGRSSQQYRETFERIRRADLASPRSTAFPDALD